MFINYLLFSKKGIDEMNLQVLNYLGVKLEKREEYSIDYLETMLDN